MNESSRASQVCIAIVGMNGIGKSNFGKRLASRLGMKRIDTDLEFRKTHGTEQQYIDTHGWDAFRNAEAEIVCRSLLPGHVVILGGGAVESPAVRAALKEHAKVLWIQAGHKRTHKNLKAANLERPEFKDGMTHAAVKTLLQTRNPHYQEVADVSLPPHVRYRDQVETAAGLLQRFIGA